MDAPCELEYDVAPTATDPTTHLGQGADGEEAERMRRLTYGMNVSVDGYVAAPGDDIGWTAPSDELFQWWSDRVATTDLALYGRRLWETMSSHWPTAAQQPGVTPAEIEFANRWMEMPKVVFSATIRTVNWNTRAWSPATPSPRSAGSKPRTAAPWTSAVPRWPQRLLGQG